MIVVKIAIIALVSYLLISSCWLMLLTLASWLYRPKLVADASPLKLLVVIPAHNEEQQIMATIDNTKKCDYPPELVDIAVIADNCKDDTAVAAANSGARVYVRTNERALGKGAALDWFLRGNREQLKDYG